jgi:hypothetical protein
MTGFVVSAKLITLEIPIAPAEARMHTAKSLRPITILLLPSNICPAFEMINHRRTEQTPRPVRIMQKFWTIATGDINLLTGL